MPGVAASTAAERETQPPSRRSHAAVPVLHRNRWMRLAVVVGVSALAGWLAGLILPRGPITAGGVVAAMAIGFGVGGVAGFVLRSRWAILVAPVVFAAACEICRIDVIGPTVDRPDFSTTFGILILILGRGYQGVTQLVPMMVGAAAGAGLARRISVGMPDCYGWRHVVLWVRRGLTVALTVALVGFATLMTRPGSTEEITDSDGRPVAGSVAELARVRLGGHEQTILIRGRSTAYPVLLYLSGGPGQSDLGYTRSYMTKLEDDFVVAVWDQRGSGTSYAALDPAETWTLNQAVADTAQLAQYLRARFGQKRIYLFGNSWGSVLGVLAVQAHPGLFQAYIGSGQMADPLATDTIIYHQVLDYARRTGDHALAERMRGYGPPPYEDIYAYAFLTGYYDKIGPYQKTDYFQTHGPSGIDGTGASEYGPLDKVNKEKALVEMGAVMYPQLQDIDFRTQVQHLEIPIYLVQGAHELTARADPARDWFDRLQAPSKRWITFEGSGHVPQFEEFPRFRDVLRGIVEEQK